MARLEFEKFLSSLTASLLNVESEHLDAAIQRSLGDLAAVLGGERGGIALFSEDGRTLDMVHAFAAPGVQHDLVGTDLVVALPWYAAELRAGRRVVGPNLADALPGEAAIERDYAATVGLKSHLALPLKVGDEVLGGIGFSHVAAHHGWTPEFMARLELLASVYAQALYRRRAQVRLRKLEEQNRSVLASVASEVVALDRDGRVLAVNEAWARSARREGSTTALAPGSDYLAACEHAAARGVVEAPLVAGIQSVLSGEKERFQAAYPFTCPSGARRHYLLTVSPLGHGGVVVAHTDVTELEEAKARLQESLREIRELKERMEAENAVLYQEVQRAQGFEGIVGSSPALARVLAQVEQVAGTDAPVLLLGETGTGKDLVARALHARSRRHSRPLVAVNCAALPAALIESELFGYERGAFTGAVQRTLGRFEVASGGTLLLDEVGELPPEVQAKLLRVLQSGEFERLGSSQRLQANVRVIAATNRNLEHEVREGRFRADLYYRLSVFPITLPPLRERTGDIPVLVWHFINRHQAAFGKSIRRVSRGLMQALSVYAWPGNVRELQNVIERALILSSGPTLALDPDLFGQGREELPAASGSLEEVERRHIRSVLEVCHWRISGHGNAAERLGLKRSTLQFRMKKLGLVRRDAAS